MDSIVRSTLIYFAVWFFFRIAGKRTLSETTTFDFVLLLVVGEATQQALLGDDFSLTNAALVIGTLVGLDVLLGRVKHTWPRADRVLEGLPVVIIEDGKPLKERMDRAQIDEDDVLEAARRTQGLERLEQIKYAVLERSGGISIIPRAKH
jgi:uncharacterized membrane protein YcaP (DUF421 family)